MPWTFVNKGDVSPGDWKLHEQGAVMMAGLNPPLVLYSYIITSWMTRDVMLFVFVNKQLIVLLFCQFKSVICYSKYVSNRSLV